MRTAPFHWVAQNALLKLLAVLTVMLVVSSAWMSWTGQILITPEAPAGIVSFELAGSYERSQEILQSWSAAAVSIALLIQGADSLYLFIYAGWYALAAQLLARRLDGPWRTAAWLTSWAVLLAAPLDAVENYGLNQQLLNGADAWHASLARWCAVPKFALVAAATAVLAITGVKRLLEGFR